MRAELEQAKKLVASVHGDMVLAFVQSKVTPASLKRWQQKLESAERILNELVRRTEN